MLDTVLTQRHPLTKIKESRDERNKSENRQSSV